MSTPFKLTTSISLALTLFFVLPWVSLFEQAEIIREHLDKELIRSRLVFLAITTFVSSMLFFQLNFFWKSRMFWQQMVWLKRTVAVVINLVMVIVLSYLFTYVMVGVFQIEMTRAFFTIYLFRNLGIAFVCMLVVYAYAVVERSKQDRIKLLTLHNEKTETELVALKTQIDPHFLFNSLNSLSGVIRKDPKEAIRFVSHLSETFRYTLANRNTNLVTLREELQFLESYLYMMNMRFGKGLDVLFRIQPEDMDKKLPQHALQLLVENAIQHNIVSTKRPLTVTVSSGENELSVSNTLQPKSPPAKGHGIGLANLKKRYELLGYESVFVSRLDTKFEVKLALL